MSDPSNLDNFFASQSKKSKKNTKKAAPKKASSAAPEQTREEEEVKADPVAAAQPEPTPAVAAGPNFGEDSSDEESNTIVINDSRQKIIDRKDLEASKKNKTEDAGDSVAGWGLGSKMGQVDNTPSQPSAASAKAPAMGGKGMNFGKPTFSRKQKGIMDNQDFPDIGSSATASANDGPTRSKADSAMMYSFGAAAKGAREEPSEEEKLQQRERAPAKKPVFTGRAKLKLPAAQDNTPSASMSYDFSKMQMSSATSSVHTEGADGERRGGRNFGAFDDDFEVVADKPKREPRKPEDREREDRPREFAEPSFGGSKPSFTRGNANRQE